MLDTHTIEYSYDLYLHRDRSPLSLINFRSRNDAADDMCGGTCKT